MDQGLTTAEAQARLAHHGRNELRRESATPAWRIFLRQFQGALVWLLLGATAVSALLREVTDAVAIAAILVINALVGFFQESRAERAMLALRSMTAPRARVMRDGASVMLPAAEVVVGDVLLLEAGDMVAADARLLEAHALTTNEATLTGESLPVEKRVAPSALKVPLAERADSVFMGTAVADGAGKAEVVATGMSTELGKIAGLLERAEVETTPLQHRLEKVGRSLMLLCLGVVIVVAVAYLWRGAGWLEVLLSSVSLAVAAVPEGLAAIVTVALAVGVQRLAKHNVLVRRLHAVETLGSTTVICTDKTGTLTRGTMTVRELWAHDEEELLRTAAANCDAELGETSKTGTGDPTELALLAAARERGIERSSIERELPRVAENPFDSDRKRMSILRADGTLYVKGALEKLLPLCDSGTDGAAEANARMAERGLRVLAIARGGERDEAHLELLGLVGLADPPRPEAVAAVATARRAGIHTVMITGDHPVTARAIATEMGILRPGDDPAIYVHARATAEDKLKIVRDWKQRGAVVAMTGDGVNDAPALKEAHIGVAMGVAGTEVTREASDMVLTRDDYASIVAAVQEGRGVFENIQKTLVYLLAGNAGELLVMLGAALLGMPLPFLPLQILWINLVTDGLPALALVTDPSHPDMLEAPPRPPSAPILGKKQWLRIGLTGVMNGALVLSFFAWSLPRFGLEEARSLAFILLVMGEMFRSFAARSDRRLFFEVGAFTNRLLLGVAFATVGIQIALHHIPFTQKLFHLTPLDVGDWLRVVPLSLIPVTVTELVKLLARVMARRRGGAPDSKATTQAPMLRTQSH
jgi:Ca2+-transporting ATPase